MAYVPSTLDAQDDEQKRLNISGSSAGPTGGGTGVGNQPVQPSAPSGSSGGFTNIRDYLSANQAGAQGLGQSVAERIGREAGEAESAIGAARDTAQSQIAQNTIGFDQNALNDTIGTGNASDTTRRMLTGSYSGPNSLADTGLRAAADKELSEAQQAAELAGSQGGRIELLRQIAGRPQSTGVTRLNSALLQTNEDARGLVNQATGRVSPLGNILSAAEQQAQAAAAAARAQNADTRARTLGALNTTLDTEEAGAQARLDAIRAQETERQAAIRRYLDGIGRVSVPERIIPEGQAQAGGSGGLIDPLNTLDRVRALNVPDTTSTEGRARIASAPAPAAPAPVEGRAMIQRASREFADGVYDIDREEGRAFIPRRVVEDDPTMYIGGTPGFYSPGGAGYVAPNTQVPITNTVPWDFVGPLAPGTVRADPPPVQTSESLAAALPLFGGFEAAGLTEAQARELQSAAYMNALDRGTGIDLTQYFSPADLTSLNRSNVLTPEQATRLSALAQLAGRQGYTSQQRDLQSRVDYDTALSALRASRAAALSTRPPAPAPAPAPVAPPPFVGPVAPAPAPVAPAPAPVAPPTFIDEGGNERPLDPGFVGPVRPPVEDGRATIPRNPGGGFRGNDEFSFIDEGGNEQFFQVRNPAPAPAPVAPPPFVGPVAPVNPGVVDGRVTLPRDRFFRDEQYLDAEPYSEPAPFVGPVLPVNPGVVDGRAVMPREQFFVDERARFAPTPAPAPVNPGMVDGRATIPRTQTFEATNEGGGTYTFTVPVYVPPAPAPAAPVPERTITPVRGGRFSEFNEYVNEL